jgi:nucleotide-binding universal stress UspA family protein
MTMLRIRTILHPTDFSKNSEYAWHMACALARDYGARLLLLHVQQPPAVAYGEFGALADDTYDREAIEGQLARVEPTDSQLAVSRHLLEGDPASLVCEFARDNEVDMIVMGSHGRTGLGRLLMGSVAELVVRRASCPVLTVKNPVAEKVDVPAPEALPVNA